MFKVDNNGVFVKFEHISHLFLVFLVLTLNREIFAGNTNTVLKVNKKGTGSLVEPVILVLHC